MVTVRFYLYVKHACCWWSLWWCMNLYVLFSLFILFLRILLLAASYQSSPAGQSESDPNNTTVGDLPVFPFLAICTLCGCMKKFFLVLQIFVGNLDSNVTEDHLRQLFTSYGELRHVKIPVGKRCGFVQFANRWV